MKKITAISLAMVMLLMCLTSCGKVKEITAEQFKTEMTAIGAKINEAPGFPYSFDASISSVEVNTVMAYVANTTAVCHTTCKDSTEAEKLLESFKAYLDKVAIAQEGTSVTKDEKSKSNGKIFKLTKTDASGNPILYSYAQQADNCLICFTVDSASYTGDLKNVLDSFKIKL